MFKSEKVIIKRAAIIVWLKALARLFLTCLVHLPKAATLVAIKPTSLRVFFY